jgi:hypothetical protein
MFKGIRCIAMLASFAAVLTLGSLPLVAQDSGTAKAEDKGETGSPKARRVPQYFGQIGLTPDQRESIYKIQAKHVAKIAALEKQIADARAAMMKECEGVLSDTQKQLLEQRRKAATGKGKAASAPDAK